MKYTIQKRLIEEYEIEADNTEEVMSFSIPDGNDYNYTGYRPFSNKDGQKLEKYRFTDRTSTGRNPY